MWQIIARPSLPVKKKMLINQKIFKCSNGLEMMMYFRYIVEVCQKAEGRMDCGHPSFGLGL
ncbi:MAG: hypothetical protein A2Z27_04795 [candidate division Zixibacteria bacterium RBG_16_50_21]|nr:MAG: hypothetical protein A2Z27_04795 [candidate division Zixibacteria bacterium RBG_16_50_21]